MELRVLRYFVTIVRERSILRAAEAMHITQPTLSRQMMDLERELGCTLFIRSNRIIALTAEGHFLYDKAKEIISLTDKTAAEFKRQEKIISGDVFIGGAETDFIRCLGAIMRNIRATNPQIKFNFYSGTADDIKGRLDSGIFDFGVLSDMADMQQYNYILLSSEQKWSILMRKDSELAQKDKITPQMLWKLPLIIPNQSMVDSKLSGWLQKNIDELNIAATYNLIYNASILVEEGLGYAITFDNLINTAGDSPLCSKLLSPDLYTPIYIAWKKNHILSKPAELFLKKLHECLG